MRLILIATLACILLVAEQVVGVVLPVSVPCGGRTQYLANISSGTQLILRNCIRPEGTMIFVVLDETSPASDSGLSIVVENCWRVAVQVSASRLLNISNLVIVMRNITNDAEEQLNSSSVVCLASPCFSLLKILQCHSVFNTTITMTDISYHRNATLMAITNIASSVAGLAMVVANISWSSSKNFIDINAVGTALTDVVVDVTAVELTSLLVLPNANSMFSMNNVPAAARITVTASGTIIQGSSSVLAAASGVFVFYLENTTCVLDCHFTVIGLTVGAQLGETNMIVAINANVTNSLMYLADITALPVSLFQGIWRGVALQQTAFNNCTIVVVNASVVTGAFTLAAVVFSDDTVLLSSSVTIHNASLENRDADAVLLLVTNAASLTDNSHATVSGCNITSPLGSVLYMVNAEFGEGTTLRVENATLRSYYAGLYFSQLRPTSRGFTVYVVDSFIAASSPLAIQSVDTVNVTVIVLRSLLQNRWSLATSSNLHLIFVSNVTLRSSHVLLTDVACIASTTTSFAAPAIYVESFACLDGSTLKMSLASVTTTVALVRISRCAIDAWSMISVSVASDMVIAPSIMVPIVVQLTNVSYHSSLRVSLPSSISSISTSLTTAGLSLTDVRIDNNSSLLLGSYGESGAASFTWSGRVATFLRMIVSGSSQCIVDGVRFVNTKQNSFTFDLVFFGSELQVTQASTISFQNCVFGTTFSVTPDTVLTLASTSLSNASSLMLTNVTCNGQVSWCATLSSLTLDTNSSLAHTQQSNATCSIRLLASTFNSSALMLATSRALLNVSMLRCNFTGAPSHQHFVTISFLPRVVQPDALAAVVAIASSIAVADAVPLPFVFIDCNSMSPSVSIVANLLYLYGRMSLVEAIAYSNTTTTQDGAVKFVDVRCSWWGRYRFTAQTALNPLQYALRGAVLRGDGSAIGSWTNIAANALSSSALLVACPPQAWNRPFDNSKSSTYTERGAISITTTASPALLTTLTSSRTLPLWSLTVGTTSQTPSLLFTLSKTFDAHVTPSLTTTRYSSDSVTHRINRSTFLTQTALSARRSHSTSQQRSTPSLATFTESVGVVRVPAVATSPTTSVQQLRPTATAIVGILGTAAGAASGSVLIRTAFTQRLARCADDGDEALDEVRAGGDDDNLFHIHVDESSAVGYGYRGALVSSILLVAGSAVVVSVGAVVKYMWDEARAVVPNGNPPPSAWSLWRRAAPAAGLPGWWLAGPCAMAVGPLLSNAVALASVSSLGVGDAARDGVLAVASLLLCGALCAWCCKALLRPAHRGWFVAVSVRRAPSLQFSARNPLARQLRWALGGAYAWEVDRRLRGSGGGGVYLRGYGALFSANVPRRHWWFLLDVATSCVVALLAALPALAVHRDDAATSVAAVCVGALHSVTAVQCLYLVLFVYFWPAAVRWECAASVTTALLGAVSALLASFAAGGAGGLDDATSALATAQLVVTIAVTVLGVSEELFAILTLQLSRRFRLFHWTALDKATVAESFIFCPPTTPRPGPKKFDSMSAIGTRVLQQNVLVAASPAFADAAELDVRSQEMLVLLVVRITQHQRLLRRERQKSQA